MVVGGSVRGALLLDDPLQGGTVGTRSGGAFVAGGWQVTGRTDTIYWHVPDVTQGRGGIRRARDCIRTSAARAWRTRSELFHMYDYTFGNSDINYNGGYRDNPFKHFIRKTGCLDTARVNSMENRLADPAQLRRAGHRQCCHGIPQRTYRFREEWGPDGAGNSVLRTYRDGALCSRRRCPARGTRRATACASRPAAAVGGFRRAHRSGVQQREGVGFADPSAHRRAGRDAAGQRTPLSTRRVAFIQWTGDPHSRYRCGSTRERSGLVHRLGFRRRRSPTATSRGPGRCRT